MKLKLREFLLEHRRKFLSDVVSRRNVTGKDYRMDTVGEPVFQNDFGRSELLVVFRIRERGELLGEAAQLLTLVTAPVVSLYNLGRRVVALEPKLLIVNRVFVGIGFRGNGTSGVVSCSRSKTVKPC